MWIVLSVEKPCGAIGTMQTIEFNVQMKLKKKQWASWKPEYKHRTLFYCLASTIRVHLRYSLQQLYVLYVSKQEPFHL